MSASALKGCLTIEWAKAATTTFIESLQQHPCTWQVKSQMYKDRNLRALSYDVLVNIMSEMIPNITIEEKINTLRGQFRKETKLIAQSKKSGAGTEEIYVPKLWCYDLLHFLDEGEVTSETTSTLDHLVASQSDYAVSFHLIID